MKGYKLVLEKMLGALGGSVVGVKCKKRHQVLLSQSKIIGGGK
jgi:hypothetical protein